MKIALFHNLPSGGAKRIVYEHVRLLSQQHQVDVYTLGTGDRDFCDVAGLARVFTTAFAPLPLLRSPFGRLNQGIYSLDLLRLRGIMRRVAGQIDRQGYDVALVHPCHFTITPPILRYLQTPAVYYRHDVNRRIHDPFLPRPYLARRPLQTALDKIDPLPRLYRRWWESEERTNNAAARLTLTNSYFVRESAYRLYGSAPWVCYHGVDREVFRPLDLPRQRQVLAVGAILPNKGYDFLIRSLASIPAGLRPPLVIVGNASDGQEKAYLESLAGGLGVQVQFRLQIGEQEVVRLYNESRLTAYTPVLESFGMAPLESMACATPVVGIAEGGVRETVVHQETGLLVERDEEQAGQAILSLLENAGLAQELGRRGRQVVCDRWTWEAAGERLVGYLNQAISSSAQEKQA